MRAKAHEHIMARILPAQAMVVGGLMLGMTLPAILSRDWSVPAAFSLRFVSGVAACLATSILTLSVWEARQVIVRVQHVSRSILRASFLYMFPSGCNM